MQTEFYSIIYFSHFKPVENTINNLELENQNNLVPLLELPGPPDGGWGWVVCFASFMCNFIVDGIVYRLYEKIIFTSMTKYLTSKLVFSRRVLYL